MPGWKIKQLFQGGNSWEKEGTTAGKSGGRQSRPRSANWYDKETQSCLAGKKSSTRRQ